MSNEKAPPLSDETRARADAVLNGVDSTQIPYGGARTVEPDHDPVNHPKHYTSHPSGVECIQIVRHFGFNIGNAVKYLWRCGLKGDEVEDLRKAIWYIEDEIKRRTQ